VVGAPGRSEDPAADVEAHRVGDYLNVQDLPLKRNDVHRFAGPSQLASWAGLTPRHHESDTIVHRGRITKQGSRLVRWAAIESVKILPDTSYMGRPGVQRDDNGLVEDLVTQRRRSVQHQSLGSIVG
jgi:Transposase IS116/IS110/IS902 family